MTDTLNLPGVTLEARDEASLEAAFGVTSNAEELVKQNRARYSPAQRTALTKPVNHELTERVQSQEEFDPEAAQYGAPANAVEAALEEAVGHPVESAVVRGKGRSAVISYTYIGERGSIEKDIIPFTEVFGSAQQQRKAKREEQARDPEQAGREAADQKLAEADRKAAEVIREAEAKAEQLIRDAAEKAQAELAKAEAKAAETREGAAEEAGEAAEDAEAKAKKAAARRSSGKSGGK